MLTASLNENVSTTLKLFDSIYRVSRKTLSALETLLSNIGGRHNYLYTYSSGGTFRVILFWSVVIFLPQVCRSQKRVIDGELRPFCTQHTALKFHSSIAVVSGVEKRVQMSTLVTCVVFLFHRNILRRKYWVLWAIKVWIRHRQARQQPSSLCSAGSVNVIRLRVVQF